MKDLLSQCHIQHRQSPSFRMSCTNWDGTVFYRSEMSLPKTKEQWHFPRLKYNGMRLVALAGSESSALLHTWSGEGFQQWAGLLKDRTQALGKGRAGLLPVQFLIPKYIYFKAEDGEELCTSLCSGCCTCPLPEAPCNNCRCPMTCSPSSLLIKNCQWKVNPKEIYLPVNEEGDAELFFSSSPPLSRGWSCHSCESLDKKKNNSGTSSRTKHCLESFNIGVTPAMVGF